MCKEAKAGQQLRGRAKLKKLLLQDYSIRVKAKLQGRRIYIVWVSLTPSELLQVIRIETELRKCWPVLTTINI